jgi:hypothetical protein
MKAWKSFSEGFIGAFALAGAIVMAIVAAASAFINADTPPPRRHETATHF